MKKFGFISFCENEKIKIIDAIKKASTNIPTKMNLPDYRFQINNLFCHSLSKEFTLGGEGGTLRPSYNAGYDMIYADTDKISIKIQKEIFQEKKKNKLLKPKSIIMKNCLGGNAKDKIDIDLDYLMTIQRGKIVNGKSLIGFGIISKNKLTNLIKVNGDDQIIVKINNEQYDYFSGLENIDVNNEQDRQSELNRVFSLGLSQMYDNILNIDNSTI